MKALFLFLIFLPTWLAAQRVDTIKIGSGGGFSGQTVSYCIHHKKITKITQSPGAPPKVSPAEKLNSSQFHLLKKGAAAKDILLSKQTSGSVDELLLRMEFKTNVH